MPVNESWELQDMLVDIGFQSETRFDFVL